MTVIQHERFPHSTTLPAMRQGLSPTDGSAPYISEG